MNRSTAAPELLRFLQALAGTTAGTAFLEIRYRLPDGVGMGHYFAPVWRLVDLTDRILIHGGRADVYVGCAPRLRRAGGRDAIERGFVLWADCDDATAVAALEAVEPAPSMVIASGTGTNRHAYWVLTEPLPRDELEHTNRRLAHGLGADPAAADAARILRPPGTWNFKHDPPSPVTALRLKPSQRVSAAALLASLPELPDGAPERRTGTVSTRQRQDVLLTIPPDSYVRELLGVTVPRHRKIVCPFHEDTAPSLHVYETPERGWYCFGSCQRGGTIYDLAAPLYGLQTREQDFLRLRHELLKRFGLEDL